MPCSSPNRVIIALVRDMAVDHKRLLWGQSDSDGPHGDRDYCVSESWLMATFFSHVIPCSEKMPAEWTHANAWPLSPISHGTYILLHLEF